MQITLPPGHPDSASLPMRGMALPPGTRLGEFEIGDVVGEGGFGVVYLAQDHLLGRLVAIKEFMPSALASRQPDGSVMVRSERHHDTFRKALDSFINEARLLAAFDHPALVKVYQFWEGNGTAYMVMPYLRGITLRAAVEQRDERPDEAWLLSLLDPLTDALGMIHAQDCWHRDIAPDNILLLENGRPVLLDFGAARRVIGDMTQDLTVILKPGYAPVEQYASGPESRQGPWTDVYALGALVYFCATGRTPVPAITRMMKDTLEPFSLAAAGRYSARFAKAIEHALAVSVEARTDSIAAFREEVGLQMGSAGSMTRLWPTQGLSPEGFSTDSRSMTGAEPQPAYSEAPDPEAQYRSSEAYTRDDERDGGLNRRSKRAVALIVLAIIAGLGAGYVYLRSGEPDRTPGSTQQASSSGAASSGSASDPAGEPGRPSSDGLQSGQQPIIDQRPGPVVPAPAMVDDRTVAGTTAADASTRPVPVPRGDAPPPAVVPPVDARPFSSTAYLERLFELRDPAWQVDVELQRPVARIGSDAIQFAIRSERAGYVYVLMRGTDDEVFQLFPNALDGNNRIGAGQKLSLPRPSWSITAAGPPGENRFVAMVAPSRRSFEAVGLGRQDPIGQFDPSVLHSAFHSAAASVLGGSPTDCDDTTTSCTSFGAAHFTIRETAD